MMVRKRCFNVLPGPAQWAPAKVSWHSEVSGAVVLSVVGWVPCGAAVPRIAGGLGVPLARDSSVRRGLCGKDFDGNELKSAMF